MPAWVWILIAIGAVILLAFLLFGRRAREKRLGQRREKAQELRQEAEVQTRRAEERETMAREQADQARAARKEAAEAAGREARTEHERGGHIATGGGARGDRLAAWT